jgi:hypothetical protein
MYLLPLRQEALLLTDNDPHRHADFRTAGPGSPYQRWFAVWAEQVNFRFAATEVEDASRVVVIGEDDDAESLRPWNGDHS